MIRRGFFKNLGGLIGIALSTKEMSKLQTPIPIEQPIATYKGRPGTNSTAFVMSIDRNYFRVGDVIIIGSMTNKFRLSQRLPDRDILMEVTDKPDRKTIEWMDKDYIDDQILKLKCYSTYAETNKEI